MRSNPNDRPSAAAIVDDIWADDHRFFKENPSRTFRLRAEVTLLELEVVAIRDIATTLQPYVYFAIENDRLTDAEPDSIFAQLLNDYNQGMLPLWSSQWTLRDRMTFALVENLDGTLLHSFVDLVADELPDPSLLTDEQIVDLGIVPVRIPSC